MKKRTPEQVARAKRNGISNSTYNYRIKVGMSMEEAITKPVLKRCPNGEYTLYKGEEQLHTGTIEELAALRGVKVSTMKYLLSPTYEKRLANRKEVSGALVLVSLDDED